MVSSIGSIQNQTVGFMRKRQSQNISSEKDWNKVLSEAGVRSEAAAQEETNVKELFLDRAGASSKVPYGYLAKDGIIEYEGVIFVCDEKTNSICLGDMTNPEEVLRIPLAEGGCLKVNRENLGELAKAITMFSPEDIRRIMEAIATDTRCQQMQHEMDETVDSIWKNQR